MGRSAGRRRGHALSKPNTFCPKPALPTLQSRHCSAGLAGCRILHESTAWNCRSALDEQFADRREAIRGQEGIGSTEGGRVDCSRRLHHARRTQSTSWHPSTRGDSAFSRLWGAGGKKLRRRRATHFALAWAFAHAVNDGGGHDTWFIAIH